MKKEEKEYYPVIKTKIEELMHAKVRDVYLEITAEKNFSEKIKSKIRPERNIIFNFLKRLRPDITGFIKNKYSSDFMLLNLREKG